MTLAGSSLIQVPFSSEAVLAYRRICEGMKVCVQITMSAVDQGYIAPSLKVIAVAGTGGKSYAKGWGVDTAVIIDAASNSDCFAEPKTMKGNETTWADNSQDNLHAQTIFLILKVASFSTVQTYMPTCNQAQ
jgi:hypothetical protein